MGAGGTRVRLISGRSEIRRYIGHPRLVAGREVARKHLRRLGGLHCDRGCGRAGAAKRGDGDKGRGQRERFQEL